MIARHFIERIKPNRFQPLAAPNRFQQYVEYRDPATNAVVETVKVGPPAPLDVARFNADRANRDAGWSK